ncbi:DUF3923 family protein [Mammaliicoccus sciuri]|uniref:DUF3923 family protein n=1 Tax=Mammaliicoccus sciuri TaxID=1296 RepID=UPI001E659D54|nr:DUF3923 family protein [Mammaliicoccus sciuri]MCD8895891.1 DUF3923 family protein [Mammaliicoccus sciuri]
MKVSWVLWWILTIIEVGAFLTFSIFLWFREVDATGAVQTTELKWFSIGIMATLFIIPFLTQLVWLIVNSITSKKLKSQNQNV